MNSKFLFPYKFKAAGLIFLVLGMTLIILTSFITDEIEFLNVPVPAIWYKGLSFGSGYDSNRFFSIVNNNILDEIASSFFIIGSLFFAFSKEKHEDEFISKLRLDSLLAATYINYGLLIFAILFFYGLAFMTVLIYNMFSLLIIFIIRFRYVLYKSKKSAEWAID